MLYNALHKKEKQNLLPDLSFEYFQGTNSTLNTSLNGYQLGVKIPILFSGNSSKIKAAKIATQVAEEVSKNYESKYNTAYNILTATLEQHAQALDYYSQYGNAVSKEIIKTAEASYKHGEIDFFQYLQSIETAKEIELDYLENLNNYNKTIIAINYLTL